MAKLLDETALGPRPIPSGRRQILSLPNAGAAERAQISSARETSRAAAGTTRALGQIAAKLQEEEDRANEAEQAVERVRATGTFLEEGNAELLRLSTEGDLSKMETGRAFGQKLLERQQTILNEHQGSDISRSRLAARLEASRHNLVGKMAAAGAKAQSELVQGQIKRDISSFSDQAYQNPGAVGPLFAALDAEVDNMAPALRPGQEEGFREGGREAIVLSAVGSLIDRGAYGEAQRVLATPGVSEIVGADNGRKLRSRITKGRLAQNKTATTGLRKLRAAEQILGQPLTAAQKERLAGVAGSARSQSLSEKIAELEGITGEALTNEQIEKLGGVETEETLTDKGEEMETFLRRPLSDEERERVAGLKKGERETLKDKLADLEKVRGEPATKEEIAKMAGTFIGRANMPLDKKIAEFTKATGGPPSDDQIAKMAGVFIKPEGEGADFGRGLSGRALAIMTDDATAFGAGLLSQADEQRFMSAATAFTQPITFQNPDTGVIETRRPELPPFVQEALRQRDIDPTNVAQGEQAAGTTTEPDVAVAETAQAAPAQAEIPQPSQTVFDLADLATGPISAAAETIGRTPIVGDLVPSPQMTQARNFIPQLQRNLVRVLQNNPRYAEGERKSIENETNISPRVFDTPSAFRNRLIGMDDALILREQAAFRTSRNPNVGRDERVAAMNVLNAIQEFRINLGVPQRVRTAEELEAIPIGQKFIDPDGTVRVKIALPPEEGPEE